MNATIRRLVIVSLFLVSQVVGQPTPSSSNELSVHFINVGQGDCTLVVFPSGKRLLVDCGSLDGPFSATKVRDYIRRNLDAQNPKIDLLVVTHPDSDHYNKIPIVLGDQAAPSIRVDKVLIVGEISEYGSSTATEEWLEEFPAERLARIQGQEYNTYPSRSLPGFEAEGVKILAANVRANKSPSNARSIVLKVSHGDFDVMITGDATSNTDSMIMDLYRGKEQELDVEVWKAAHHGSWATATQTSSWADVVKPEMVVFSCSATNDHGHPNRKLAELFKDYTVPVKKHRLKMFDGKNKPTTSAALKPFLTEAMYSTASSGTIIVRSRGSGFTTEFSRN